MSASGPWTGCALDLGDHADARGAQRRHRVAGRRCGGRGGLDLGEVHRRLAGREVGPDALDDAARGRSRGCCPHSFGLVVRPAVSGPTRGPPDPVASEVTPGRLTRRRSRRPSGAPGCTGRRGRRGSGPPPRRAPPTVTGSSSRPGGVLGPPGASYARARGGGMRRSRAGATSARRPRAAAGRRPRRPAATRRVTSHAHARRPAWRAAAGSASGTGRRRPARVRRTRPQPGERHHGAHGPAAPARGGEQPGDRREGEQAPTARGSARCRRPSRCAATPPPQRHVPRGGQPGAARRRPERDRREERGRPRRGPAGAGRLTADPGRRRDPTAGAGRPQGAGRRDGGEHRAGLVQASVSSATGSESATMPPPACT